MKRHMKLLGLPVKDLVTGTEGIVTSVSYDLYGCVQALVDPGLDKDGKRKDSRWFDVARLETTSDTPVMPVPDFDAPPEVAVAEGRKGPAERPSGMTQ